MKLNMIFKLVLSALFAALTAVVTYFPVPVPIAHGYVNLGDCFVILSGIILGPAYGFLAAGIGSAFADILVGFVCYAPATFIIKGLMAVAVYYIIGKKLGRFSVLKTGVAVLSAELIMVAGYFAFELMLYGGGAVASITGNCIQGVCCAVLGGILAVIASKSGLADRIKNGKAL